MFYYEYSYLDWNGNPIERTPNKNPYSFDPYVIFKTEQDYNGCVYSDRLMQWDFQKYNTLLNKHFGNEGQIWDGREKDKIQDFLRDYLENQSLKLVGMMKGCNVSNGFPYWLFMYNI